jgi:magnesium-transporting ATPase (P-type)
MSIYQTLWKNDKNRTLLISSIIVIGTLIVAIIFASLSYETAGFLRIWYFVDQDVPHYSWGLVVAEITLLSLFYFFLLISLAIWSEMRAKLPSWGTFITSSIIAILITWLITSIRPRGSGLPSNFTAGMQWTIFGVLIAVIIASIFYIFFLEEDKVDRPEKAKVSKTTKKKTKTEKKIKTD